jgi:hypothetical protein
MLVALYFIIALAFWYVLAPSLLPSQLESNDESRQGFVNQRIVLPPFVVGGRSSSRLFKGVALVCLSLHALFMINSGQEIQSTTFVQTLFPRVSIPSPGSLARDASNAYPFLSIYVCSNSIKHTYPKPHHLDDKPN